MKRMKKNMALFGCVFLGFFVLSLLYVPGLVAQTKVGTVSAIEGQAFLTHRGEAQGAPIQVGTTILQNDTIRTTETGKLRVVFIDRSIISIGPSTYLTVNEYVFNPREKERSSSLRVVWGKVKCFVNDFTGYRSKKFNLTTNTAVIGVRGTVYVLNATLSVTDVAALENELVITPSTTPIPQEAVPFIPPSAGPLPPIQPSTAPPASILVLQPNQTTKIILVAQGTGSEASPPIMLTAEHLQQLQEGLLGSDLGLTPPTDLPGEPGFSPTDLLGGLPGSAPPVENVFIIQVPIEWTQITQPTPTTTTPGLGATTTSPPAPAPTLPGFPSAPNK